MSELEERAATDRRSNPDHAEWQYDRRSHTPDQIRSYLDENYPALNYEREVLSEAVEKGKALISQFDALLEGRGR